MLDISEHVYTLCSILGVQYSAYDDRWSEVQDERLTLLHESVTWGKMSVSTLCSLKDLCSLSLQQKIVLKVLFSQSVFLWISSKVTSMCESIT